VFELANRPCTVRRCRTDQLSQTPMTASTTCGRRLRSHPTKPKPGCLGTCVPTMLTSRRAVVVLDLIVQ
jgi:hypothetical protein